MSARLIIRHPAPNGVVLDNLILAQGDLLTPILNLLGVIWSPNSKVVAMAVTSANPPGWFLPFFAVPVGQGYCLEMIDLNTKERLACAGPFDVIHRTVHGPTITYPHANDTVSPNVAPYGTYAAGKTVAGKMTRNGAFLQNGTPIPLPGDNWGLQFTGLTTSANFDSRLDVWDAADMSINNHVEPLRIQ